MELKVAKLNRWHAHGRHETLEWTHPLALDDGRGHLDPWDIVADAPSIVVEVDHLVVVTADQLAVVARDQRVFDFIEVDLASEFALGVGLYALEMLFGDDLVTDIGVLTDVEADFVSQFISQS